MVQSALVSDREREGKLTFTVQMRQRSKTLNIEESPMARYGQSTVNWKRETFFFSFHSRLLGTGVVRIFLSPLFSIYSFSFIRLFFHSKLSSTSLSLSSRPVQINSHLEVNNVYKKYVCRTWKEERAKKERSVESACREPKILSLSLSSPLQSLFLNEKQMHNPELK